MGANMIEERLKQIEALAERITVATRTVGSDWGMPHVADWGRAIVESLAAIRESIAEMEKQNRLLNTSVSNIAAELLRATRERDQARAECANWRTGAENLETTLANKFEETDRLHAQIASLKAAAKEAEANRLQVLAAWEQCELENKEYIVEIEDVKAAAKERDARVAELERALEPYAAIGRVMLKAGCDPDDMTIKPEGRWYMAAALALSASLPAKEPAC